MQTNVHDIDVEMETNKKLIEIYRFFISVHFWQQKSAKECLFHH
ncbi:hypothetical protein PPHE_a1175 [Pseudoalteromonas phenolica O-BC30]|nr:hypothetical protein [Pseudoalteromonas phenolica O-BC30]